MLPHYIFYLRTTFSTYTTHTCSQRFCALGYEIWIKNNILKDDGCNKDVIFSECESHNRLFFYIQNCRAIIQDSNKHSSENSSKVIKNGENSIRNHIDWYNWAVRNCGYDILLGMPGICPKSLSWTLTLTPFISTKSPSTR